MFTHMFEVILAHVCKKIISTQMLKQTFTQVYASFHKFTHENRCVYTYNTHLFTRPFKDMFTHCLHAQQVFTLQLNY